MRELFLIIMCCVPLALLNFTAKYDEEIKVHMHKKNQIYLGLFSIAGAIFTYLKFNKTENMFIVSIVLSYLIVISFTDQMIKKVYMYISVLYCIIGIIIYIMCATNQLHNLFHIVVYILSVIVMSKLRFFAKGDVDIFITLSFYIITLYSTYILPIELLLIHMLIALIIFIGINIKLVIKKDRSTKPYALSISLSTFILICLV